MDIFMPDDVDKTVFVVGFDEFGGAQGLETDVKPLGIGGPRSRRAADGDGDRRKFRGGIKLREAVGRSEEHTSELQSLMRNSYAVFCLKTKKKRKGHTTPQLTIPSDKAQVTTIISYTHATHN